MPAPKKLTPALRAKILELFEQDKYTEEEICNTVKINRKSLEHWKKGDPTLKKEIEEAKAKFMKSLLGICKNSLRKMCDFWETEETITTMGTNEDGKPYVKEVKKFKKTVAPNAACLIFSLKNADPTNFKDNPLPPPEVKNVKPPELLLNTEWEKRAKEIEESRKKETEPAKEGINEPVNN